MPKGDRAGLLPILSESFQGMYLWHARHTLKSVEVVLAARTAQGELAGLIMLKMLAEGPGYVYYVAVPPRFRRQGIGGILLDEAISRFSRAGLREVYAGVEEDNVESRALFGSRGFERLQTSEMAGRYGRVRSLLMYREMMLVPGEQLLCKRLEAGP